MKSYNDIDYRIRVRKFVERQMIKDSCQRLYYFDHLNKYRYIGFGSLYFVDFKLFHKALGIEDMISIEFEPNERKQLRFEFNKPYDFIKMNFNRSTEALNEIEHDKRTIIWLDYDGNLEKYMFDDLEIMLDKLASGSVFIISLNTSINGIKTSKLVIELNKLKEKLKFMLENFQEVMIVETSDGRQLLDEIALIIHKTVSLRANRIELKQYCKEIEKKFLNYLSNIDDNKISAKERLEINELITKIINLVENQDNCREKNLRVDRFKKDYEGFLTRQVYSESDLVDKKSHIIIKEMFDVQINNIIRRFNETRSDDKKLIYKQLYYFTYKDGACMLTFGGILYEKHEEEYYNRACFQDLDYIRSEDEEYNINIPMLTYKEMEYANNPISSLEESAVSIDTENIQNISEYSLYKKIYRYLPHFTNSDNL